MKFVLTAAPTFKAKVDIPIAGAAAIPVEFTFKHMTREAFNAWRDALDGKTDTEAFLDIVSGWGLEDAFTPENVTTLLENHMGAGAAVYAKYRGELTGEKAKN